MPPQGDSHPDAVQAPPARHGAPALPPWALSLLMGTLGLSVGGVSGSVVTSGQLQTVVQSAEVRLGGKLDLLGTKVDRAIADTDRLSTRQDKLAERIAAVELENARRASAAGR